MNDANFLTPQFRKLLVDAYRACNAVRWSMPGNISTNSVHVSNSHVALEGPFGVIVATPIPDSWLEEFPCD